MLKTFKQASALYNEARSRRSPVIYLLFRITSNTRACVTGPFLHVAIIINTDTEIVINKMDTQQSYHARHRRGKCDKC